MVYMLLADGFEEMEAVIPLDVLRRCGVEILTVAVCSDNSREAGLRAEVLGSHNITVKADILLDEVVLDSNIKMLILPGGPGRVNIRKSERATEIINYCCKSGIYVAAICGAPEILGELGHLQGKNATCFPGLENNLTGAVIVDEPVVVDGMIITSKSAGTSEAFAFTIAQLLCGKEKADAVRKSMLCR
jgi:4-methyl-5(b-hydroxyethyl)-thiazole monophosphate biosynthesis